MLHLLSTLQIIIFYVDTDQVEDTIVGYIAIVNYLKIDYIYFGKRGVKMSYFGIEYHVHIIPVCIYHVHISAEYQD